MPFRYIILDANGDTVGGTDSDEKAQAIRDGDNDIYVLDTHSDDIKEFELDGDEDE